MPHAYTWIIGATLIALVSTKSVAETPPPGTSGIEGTVLISPSRPGPITKDGPSVAPARNVQFLVKAGEAIVKSFTTDGDGRFQIALPPGHYVVLREDPG